MSEVEETLRYTMSLAYDEEGKKHGIIKPRARPKVIKLWNKTGLNLELDVTEDVLDNIHLRIRVES